MQPIVRIILVHYHELGLKGKNRKVFEQRLIDNLRGLYKSDYIEHIGRISGRIVIYMTESASYSQTMDLARKVTRVPGVARVTCGFRCERDLSTFFDIAIRALGEALPAESFKVIARRSHTDFEYDSMQLNALVGEALCEHFPELKVKMKNPDVEVRVEVVQGSAYISAFSVPGVGGLPVGSAGKVICLLSSGIDSPVALWRMARRGATCIGLHFSGRPQAPSTSEYLVQDIAQVLHEFGGISRVYVVPFGDYQREIALNAPSSLRIILYRRLMMRVAERLAKNLGAKALVTGESLGQVASQTLDNMSVVAAAVDMQIMRPLIGSDKLEIISDAQKLGTFDISSVQADDCCTLFMPKSPETHAKLDAVLEVEQAFPIEQWVEEIVHGAELLEVSNTE